VPADHESAAAPATTARSIDAIFPDGVDSAITTSAKIATPHGEEVISEVLRTTATTAGIANHAAGDG